MNTLWNSAAYTFYKIRLYLKDRFPCFLRRRVHDLLRAHDHCKLFPRIFAHKAFGDPETRQERVKVVIEVWTTATPHWHCPCASATLAKEELLESFLGREP